MQRLQVEPAGPVQPLQVEGRRDRMFAATERRRCTALGVPDNAPDEHGKQREHDADRQHLAGPAQADRHQAEMMNTGVPTFTWPNSHSAEGIAMRMQP